MKTAFKTILLLLLISFSGISFSQTCLQWAQKIEASRKKIEMNRMKLAELERAKAKPILTRSYINEINKEKILKAEYQNSYKLCMGNNKKLPNENKAPKTKTDFDTERKLAKQKEQEQIKAREKCTLLAKQIEACRVAIETARAQLMPLENSAGPVAKINSLKTQINNEKAKKAALQQQYMKCGAGNEAQAKLSNANKNNKTMTNDLAYSSSTKAFNAKQADKSTQRQNQLANREKAKINEQEKKCVSISKQIEACRVTIEAARAKLLPLENSKSPFNKSKIEALNAQINTEKTKKAALQQQYMNCGTGAKFANSNKDNKTITKDKAAKTTSKKTALIEAWENEFKLTNKHDIDYTLSNNLLSREFEKHVKVGYGGENINFYNYVSKPVKLWNLKYIYSQFIIEGAVEQININAAVRKQIIKDMNQCNFVIYNTSNDLIIKKSMDLAKNEIKSAMLEKNFFPTFTRKMDKLLTESKSTKIK
jgi:hypothetical protein